MMTKENGMSISNPHPIGMDWIQKLGLAIASIGFLILMVAWLGITYHQNGLFLSLSLGSLSAGILLYTYGLYRNQPAGIKNNHVFLDSLSSRGLLGWVAGIILTSFYVFLYWFPAYLGLETGENAENQGLVALFDPLSQLLKGKNASQWFMYGTIYTLLILALGIKFMVKYRHNRYQLIRTIVVMVAQLFLAFLIPEIMEGLNTETPYFAKDLKYFWPLNYYFFDAWHLNNMTASGSLGMFYLVWGIVGFLVLTPVITYYVGKRWYCSWLCGCAGLAETAGDSFRQLSSKKISAWKLERWLIHSVMIFIFVVTAVVLYGYFTNNGQFLGLDIYTYFSKTYGRLL